MHTASSLHEQAAALYRAETSKVPVAVTPQPLSLAEAYAVQSAGLALRKQAGRSLRGYKIGLTSRALQKAAGAAEPVYGVLTDAMIFPTGSEMALGRFIRPRLEVELAFVLGRPLAGSSLTLCDVLKAVDFVVPALEIVDSRLAPSPPGSRPPGLPDIVSDNAASAGIVLGASPIRPDKLDLAWVSAVCRRNGLIEETGVAAAVLNHPAAGLRHLADHLARHPADGEKGLEAGQIILGGAFTTPLDIRDNDTFQVDYGPPASFAGAVTCFFSEAL